MKSSLISYTLLIGIISPAFGFQNVPLRQGYIDHHMTDTALHAETPSFRKKIRKSLFSVALVSSILTGRSTPAKAKFSYELRETPTHSIRPGMNKVQADQLENGALDLDNIESTSVFSTSDSESMGKKAPQAAKSYGYGDDEEDEEDEYEEVVGARQSDQAVAQRLQSSTKSQFAAYHQGKSGWLTFKVGVALFVPTFGAQSAREWYRRRKEEEYVKKGLEIQAAQRAEYFNITSKTADSDVEDELKGLKNNATKTDEDDDDDGEDDDEDDDDDDAEPEPPSSRRPKKPSPRGDGPSGSRGDGDSNPGYGKPSDEDLDRLNRMFGKS